MNRKNESELDKFLRHHKSLCKMREFGIAEAARTLGVTRNCIGNCLRGRAKSGAGFIWRYDVSNEK